MKDLMYDQLFSNFLYSADLELNNELLKEECLKYEEYNSTVFKSNRKGWQSDLLTIDDRYPHLNDLRKHIEIFANTVAGYENVEQSLYIDSSWININRKGAFNLPHNHGSAALVVVYYVNTPHPPAELGLLRADGAQLSEFYRSNIEKTQMFISPKAGRAYSFPAWVTHFVTEEQSQSEPRISIAFNLKLK